jgi:16S rRNA (cytidine1402-2'-O)-methyltransferase
MHEDATCDDLPEMEPEALRPETKKHAASSAFHGLLLVSTPIGNLGDMTPRAAEALQQADLVLCEDTRHSALLFTRLGIAVRTETLHEHNETARVPALLARLQAGQSIAVISDAGTPLVSDPGYRLVRAAIEAGIQVTALPGANAAVTALVLSGLPPLPFLALGFPPPRQAARQAAFARLRAAEQAGLSATLLWYEAPHRLAETLADLAACFGPRPAAVARELTKRFEEIRRGTLAELAAHYAGAPPRGEICIVVGPAPEEQADAADLDARLRAALTTLSLRDAAAAVAVATGLPRKAVYARALELAKAGPENG